MNDELYITGKHALNLKCSLNTAGDWHFSSLSWDENKIQKQDLKNSFYKEWGIENGSKGLHANHLRAILDLMLNKEFGFLIGFRNDFICTDEYDQIFFDQVSKLRKLQIWEDVDRLMYKEFKKKWFLYKMEVFNER